MPKIITTRVYPPIPIRTMDWQAHYDGEEDEQMATGHGATEAEAIRDLVENHSRDDEVLAALKDLLADCVEYARINNLHNSEGSPGTHHAMRRAAAAIARAESRTA